MSARVSNPVLVSDLRNLRTASSNEVRVRPNLAAVNRIRRSLFGPVDHESNRKFLDEEFTKIHEQASQKWGFDFKTESPLRGSHRYVWESVNETSFIPEAYALRISTPELSSAQDEAPVETAVEPQNTERVRKCEVTPPSQIQKQDDLKNTTSKQGQNIRQVKITHYMKKCKRQLTGKKLDSTVTKKRRLASPSSS